MYLLRIEVKCFSRILCLPKLLEFPHISSLLSFLILSHHELFCAIPFCNHLSLIRALLLSLSLFISSSLSIYLSALSHEESDFYHLSTDERTALCWHISFHLISSHIISSHIISYHLISSHFISSHFNYFDPLGLEICCYWSHGSFGQRASRGSYYEIRRKGEKCRL